MFFALPFYSRVCFCWRQVLRERSRSRLPSAHPLRRGCLCHAAGRGHASLAQRVVSRSRLLRSVDRRTARAADRVHVSGVDSRAAVFGRARYAPRVGSERGPRDSDLHARQLRRGDASAEGLAGLRPLGRCQLPHDRRHGEGPVESDHQHRLSLQPRQAEVLPRRVGLAPHDWRQSRSGDGSRWPSVPISTITRARISATSS